MRGSTVLARLHHTHIHTQVVCGLSGVSEALIRISVRKASAAAHQPTQAEAASNNAVRSGSASARSMSSPPQQHQSTDVEVLDVIVARGRNIGWEGGDGMLPDAYAVVQMSGQQVCVLGLLVSLCRFAASVQPPWCV
jgi:hypothetical protein